MIYWIISILTIPYFILLFDLYRHLLRIKPFRKESTPEIFVSVIIACKNEQQNIPDLLISLSQQEYNRNLFEVIIVDDHSTDNTVAAARSYEYHLNLRILANESSGKKHAIKKGVEAAKGELIITTDADCSPPVNWLNTIISFYLSYKPELIIAPVQLSRKKGFFGRFQELEFLSLQGITAAAAAANRAVMCNGANLTFTREGYFRNVGHLRFDIATGDDVFLLHSMKNNKSSVMWLESPEAIVETKSAPDLKAFLDQRKRWASKSTAYRDGFSILLGIVTFVTNLSVAALAFASLFNTEFLKGFLLAFMIKSIPDFVILQNTTGRYNRKELMWWFLPCQVVYPFYVITVAITGLSAPSTLKNKWHTDDTD